LLPVGRGTLSIAMVRRCAIESSLDNLEIADTIQTVCLSWNVEPGGDLMNIEPVTEGELSILEVIWKQGTPTSRDIATAIYEKVSDSKMASVQKLLERLESKGCVSRDRRERAHRFLAVVSREDFLQHKLEGLADRLCDGAIAPLVTTLLRSKQGISKKAGQELRRLIDELWPTNQRS
jgi:predicted transcriptional regulator